MKKKGVLGLRNNKVQKPESTYYVFRIQWMVGMAEFRILGVL